MAATQHKALGDDLLWAIELLRLENKLEVDAAIRKLDPAKAEQIVAELDAGRLERVAKALERAERFERFEEET
jgi:hypothetical protein